MQTFFFAGGDWGGKLGVLWRCANDEYDIYLCQKMLLW